MNWHTQDVERSTRKRGRLKKDSAVTENAGVLADVFIYEVLLHFFPERERVSLYQMPNILQVTQGFYYIFNQPCLETCCMMTQRKA